MVENINADARYESPDNYLYPEANGQLGYIKPTNYEAQKTKKFRSLIGRIEDMAYSEEDDCFICAENRRLDCQFAMPKNWNLDSSLQLDFEIEY